jgi:hypothetical protein
MPFHEALCAFTRDPAHGAPRRRRSVVRTLTSTLLFGLILSLRVGTASVIVFNDLTDSVTASGSTRLTGANCFRELCGVILLAPAGATLTATDLPATTYISEWSDRTIVSDELAVSYTAQPSPQFAFAFFSDDDSPTQAACSNFVEGCRIQEDGSALPIGSITWSDGTVDTIKVQSDVPEPATILLSLCVFAVLRINNRGSLGGYRAFLPTTQIDSLPDKSN